MFVARIDVSPKDVNKSTVECLAYNKHKGHTWLWCGLSTGEIQLVQLEGYHVKQRLHTHRQIVTCVKVVNDTFLWSGSFDTTIKVTNINSKKAVATLEAHTDAITCMTNDGNCMWSASINGQLLRWNIDRKELDDWPRDFQLLCPRSKKPLSLYSMVIIEDQIWCGTGSSIAIFDPQKRRVVEHIVSTDGTSYTCQDKSSTKASASTTTDTPTKGACDAGWGIPRSLTVPSRVRSASTGASARDAARAATATRQRQTRTPTVGPGSRDGWVLLDAPPIVYPSSSASPSKTPNAQPGSRRFLRPGDSPSATRRAPLFTPLTPPSPFSGARPTNPPSTPGQTRYPASRDALSPARFPEHASTYGIPHHPTLAPNRDANGAHPKPLPVSNTGASTPMHRHNASAATTTSGCTTPKRDTAEDTTPPPPPHLLSEFWDGGGAAATTDASAKLSLSPVRPASLHGWISPQRLSHPHHSSSHRGDGRLHGHSGHTGQGIAVADMVASHCIATGSDGQLWTSSESKGLVQVWSTVTRRLLQSWELSSPGINHMVHVRGHMWVAGSTGSVYIWDAGLRVPVAEINAHSDAVRGLCAVGTAFVLSHSGFKDGSIGVFRAVARGRVILASKRADKSVQSYDRYGFCLASEASPHRNALAYMDGSDGGPADSDQEDILSTSLPEAWKQEALSKQERYTKHTKEWEDFWSARQGTASESGLQTNPEFRRLLDACGIPEKFRTLVWTELLRVWLGQSVDEVDASFRRSRRISTKMYKQIELDLHRTFPSNKHFQSSGPAIRKLRRVLHAFVTFNTSVQYCQGFNFIAAFALLFLTETLAMRAVVCIIEHIMPKGYYTDPMLASRADQPVLRECVTAHLPTIDAVLRQHDFDLSIVTFNWFFTAFVDCVPVDIVVLVWDMLFTYGDIVLFRFAYALLKSHEATIIAVKDPFDMFVTMRALGNACPDAETMLTWVNACPITEEFVEQRRRFHCDTITAADRDVQQVLLERRRLELLKAQGKNAKDASEAKGSDMLHNAEQAEARGALEVPATRHEGTASPAAIGDDMVAGAEPVGTADQPSASMSRSAGDGSSAATTALPAPAIGSTETNTAAASGGAHDHGPADDDDLPIDVFSGVPVAVDVVKDSSEKTGLQMSDFSSFAPDAAAHDEDEEGEGRKERLGSAVSNASRDSTDSWVDVEDGYDMRPRAVPFDAKSSHVTVFNATQTGGTGDGILHPTGTTLAQSMSRWIGTRMSLGRTIPTGSKWTPGCSSGSSNDVPRAVIPAIEEQDIIIGGSSFTSPQKPPSETLPAREPPNNSLCNRYDSMDAYCNQYSDVPRTKHHAADAPHAHVSAKHASGVDKGHSRSNSGTDAAFDIFFPQMEDSEEEDFF
eukprot:m.1589607 g.1589607  ORF g.1589607 m.1589607 type:complete len:1374 (+) comp25334_c0_seq20:206-4327(+)